MMRWLLLSLLLLPVLPVGSAPPASATGGTLEQRIAVLERKVRALSELTYRMDALQREVQQLRGEVELQSHTLEGIKQRQRTLYLDIDQRLGQLRTTPGAVDESDPQTPAAPVSETPDTTEPVQPLPEPAAPSSADPALEESAYQQAFEILMQRRYGDAQVALKQFLADYPSGQYAANAQYWLAEASYVTRDFDSALEEFAKVLSRYPDSTKVPDALLKSGFILYEQKRWAEARTSLQQVMNEYPISTAARLAKQRLDRMSSEGR